MLVMTLIVPKIMMWIGKMKVMVKTLSARLFSGVLMQILAYGVGGYSDVGKTVMTTRVLGCCVWY